MKKKNLLFVPFLAMALVGCNTNDEMVGDLPIEFLPGVNTVSFTNNTSLVIGEGQMDIKAAVSRAANPATENAAYGLGMCASVDEVLTEKGITRADCFILSASGNYSEIVAPALGNYNCVYVPAGITLTIDQNLESSVTLFVDGALNVNAERLSNIEIQCWGVLNLSKDVKLYKSKVFAAFGISGKNVDVALEDASVYSGGDFACKELTTNNTVLRVDGQLSYSDSLSEFKKTGIYVDDALTLDHLSLTDGSELYVNCLLKVNSEMKVTASKVTALSILNKNAKLCQATIALPAAGCAKFTTLDFVNYDATTSNYLKFENVAGNNVTSGTQVALVVCDEFRFYKTDAVKELTLGEDVYLNYNTACLAYNYEPIDLNGEYINVEGVVYIGGVKDCHLNFKVPAETPSYTDADVILTIPTEIAAEEWFLKADDFAIRVDGQYQDVIQVKDGVTALEDIRLTEENLKVAVKGVANLEADKDYTYEVWLWIDENTWLETFTDADRAAWVSGDGAGTDITEACTIVGPKGYTLRKNVYKGLSGHADTPYIKVSIHITKDKE